MPTSAPRGGTPVRLNVLAALAIGLAASAALLYAPDAAAAGPFTGGAGLNGAKGAPSALPALAPAGPAPVLGQGNPPGSPGSQAGAPGSPGAPGAPGGAAAAPGKPVTDNPLMWALPAAWLVMMIVALLKHRAGKMVIMYNLTDAAVTLGTFLTPVISMWIFKGSYGREVDPETKDYIVYAVTALVMLFLAVCSVRISIAKNPGPATMALSVIVKFTLSAMVVILLFGRLSKKSAGRRGGEGGLAYGPGAPGQRVSTAFLLALALALFYMMIKSKEFSGLSDCFAREPLPEGD